MFPQGMIKGQWWLHPGTLTWNLKISCLKRRIIFQTSIFGFHVNFQGCSNPLTRPLGEYPQIPMIALVNCPRVAPQLPQAAYDRVQTSCVTTATHSDVAFTRNSGEVVQQLWYVLEDETYWVVVSNIFYFHPYLGKIPILTNIFQRGWNHQLVLYFSTYRFRILRIRG